MLERVTLGQVRFAMPGIAPDSRGIVVGKSGALLFPALDGVVRWLRLYADEDSLDDLLPGARLARVVSALKSRAFLLLIPAISSHVLDRASRCARLAGGATFTGTTRHYVKYRDEKAPHGYDVADLGTPAAGVDHVLHGDEAVLQYGHETALDLTALILRLSLVRVPGAERLDAEARSTLLLSVAAGLGPGLLRYLARAQVRAEVATLTYERTSAFTSASDPLAALLLRARELPERLLGSLRGVPGLTIYRPSADNLGVEVGYRHPISLSSVASIFQRDRVYLFQGAADRLDVIEGPLVFSSADHLGDARLRPKGTGERLARTQAGAPGLELGVALRLVPTLTPPRRVIASLIPWTEAARLKKLVYALPPVLLRGHTLAPTERGLLLVASEGVDVVPLGTLLCEAAPGLFVPVGMDLLPRVPVDVLLGALDHQGGAGGRRITVFPHDGPPFFVSASDLLPLERRVVAKIAVAAAPTAPDLVTVTQGEAGHIVNDAVGRFALWGFEGPPVPK